MDAILKITPGTPVTKVNVEEAANQVADEEKLTGRLRARYVAFMTAWATEEDEMFTLDYMGEWADRFKGGDEYDRSDLANQRRLRKIDGRA